MQLSRLLAGIRMTRIINEAFSSLLLLGQVYPAVDDDVPPV